MYIYIYICTLCLYACIYIYIYIDEHPIFGGYSPLEAPCSPEDHTGAWNANTVVGSWYCAALDAEVQTLEPPRWELINLKWLWFIYAYIYIYIWLHCISLQYIYIYMIWLVLRCMYIYIYTYIISIYTWCAYCIPWWPARLWPTGMQRETFQWSPWNESGQDHWCFQGSWVDTLW